jgi:hypothetical protein
MDSKAKFTDNKGFEITLTDDKVYVTTVGSQETFALRSVNGIGTYDDIEQYNKDLEAAKKMDKRPLKYFGIFFIAIAVTLLLASAVSDFNALGLVVVILPFAGWLYIKGAKSESPEDIAKMKSYFRIMLSGGDREFQFDKKASNAVDVADFCNKVEDTLTAYNK